MMKRHVNSYKDFQTVKYKSFESTVSHWTAGQNRFLSNFFNNDNRGIAILDAGCGDGCGLNWFKKHYYNNVFGCDLSYEKTLRAKASEFSVCVTDLHNLPFISNKFDVVYASHVIEHTHDPIKATQEFYRILKPDGYLVIVVPFPDLGPNECHCGKFVLKTDPISVSQIGDKGIINFFKSKFIILETKTDDYREPEIWLRLKRDD